MSYHVVWRHVTWCDVISRGVTSYQVSLTSLHVGWRYTWRNCRPQSLTLNHWTPNKTPRQLNIFLFLVKTLHSSLLEYSSHPTHSKPSWHLSKTSSINIRRGHSVSTQGFESETVLCLKPGLHYYQTKVDLRILFITVSHYLINSWWFNNSTTLARTVDHWSLRSPNSNSIRANVPGFSNLTNSELVISHDLPFRNE